MKNRVTTPPTQKEINELVADLNAAGVRVTTGDNIPSRPIKTLLEKDERLNSWMNQLRINRDNETD